MRRSNSILMILIALWLPLQAVASWAMPVCVHATAPVSAAPTVVETGAHCHEYLDDTPVPSASAFECDSCDNCGICHLASTGFLPAVVGTAAVSLTACVLVPTQILASPSHIGDPPQQPPRHTS
jgi:hypothetical protein